MSPTHHPAIESWWSSGGFTLVLVAASILYLRGRHRLHSASVRVIPGWRAGSLFLGLISIWVALGSPLAVDPGLIRLSVGLETLTDLIDDLRQALDKVAGDTA